MSKNILVVTCGIIAAIIGAAIGQIISMGFADWSAQLITELSNL